MAEDGRFFGGYDDFLSELGASPSDMVEAIIGESANTISDE